MSKKIFSISSAPTSIQSKCSSSSISVISSPSFKSPSVSSLQKSLSTKQLRLTESLILYSQELSLKIPKIALKWNLENARLRNLLKKNKDLKKLSSEKNKQREKIDKQKNRVKKIEDLVFNDKKELMETKKKVESLHVKSEEFKIIERVLNDLEIKRVKLVDRIRTFNRYKGVSREQLDQIMKNSRKIKKLEDLMEVRMEEVLIAKEDVTGNCFRVEKCTDCVRKEIKEAQGHNMVWEKKCKKEIEVLSERFKRISLLNYAKRQDLKNFKDKIEANLALIRLENKHVDNRRRKIKEVAEWIKNQLSLIKTSQNFASR